MTDESIMESVKRGDLPQASVLFDRYHKAILNFLTKMTMDRELAEDLTQNVFFRIIRYRSSYKEGARFQSWIYQIARNVFADHYQTQKHRRTGFVDIENIREQVPDTMDVHDQEEREQTLMRCLNQLSTEQRELLVMTRFQHMKYEEVASIMNTTVANIKVKVHRAIHKLREHYFLIEKN